MIFARILLLCFVLRGVECSSLLPRRISKAELTQVSKGVFKDLQSETWKETEFAAGRTDVREGLLKPAASRDPTKTDLNSTKLKELLANGFQPQYMSEARPSRAWRDADNTLDERHAFELYKEKSGMDDFVRTLFNDKGVDDNQNQFEDINFWIWNLTRCTVQAFWKDFGAKIWPRYVNVGRCLDKPSCSIPRGMKCRPSEIKTVKLLYWICPVPKSISSATKQKDCFWASFETEVIRACHCSC